MGIGQFIEHTMHAHTHVGLLPTFPVAAARAWNGLPYSIRAASSLQLFCRELKTALFSLSFDSLTLKTDCGDSYFIVKCPCNSYTVTASL